MNKTICNILLVNCFIAINLFSAPAPIAPDNSASGTPNIQIAPPSFPGVPTKSTPTTPGTPGKPASTTPVTPTTPGETGVNTTTDHSIEDDGGQSLNPGIVAVKNGQWVWSDHLLNVSNNIDVSVEITKPDKLELPIKNADLQLLVSAIFKKNGINPVAAPAAGKPNLPSFHILILVYPIRDGYSLSVTGRLFEAVKLDRIKLDEAVTMQAVTWDRTSIHIVSGTRLKTELEDSVTEVSNDFVERYKFFEKVRTSAAY